MNDNVREVLEDEVRSLDARIKWAGEAAIVAKQNLHGRESELSDLHRSRKAILDHLKADQIADLVAQYYLIHEYVWTGGDDE